MPRWWWPCLVLEIWPLLSILGIFLISVHMPLGKLCTHLPPPIYEEEGLMGGGLVVDSRFTLMWLHLPGRRMFSCCL